MSDVDNLIQKVSKESKLSVDEVKSKMTDRKDKTHGLLSDYGALYAVAKEYGIDLSDDEIQVHDISSVKPQSSTNICGRVNMVYSPKEFKRKDNTTGKFASVVLVDKTGQIRIVLWDSNAEMTKKIHVGDTLFVKNGFVKDNRGVIEVHASKLTNLTLNPDNINADLPEVQEKIAKINDLTDDMDSVTLHCRVNSYYPMTEFQRPDGSTGKRASFIAQDASGTVRVVLWGSNAETELDDGKIVKIENAYTRLGLNSEIEVQAGNRSRILDSDSTLDLPPLEKKTKIGEEVKISEIKPDLRGFTTAARIVRIYPPREYSKGKMSSMILADETGTMRAVLWDEKSDITNELKEGDAVKIVNAYSKANLNDEPEIHIGKYGEVLVNQELPIPSMDELNKVASSEKKISDLENNESNVKITAQVVDVNTDRPLVYMNCPSCSKKAQSLGGDWFCDSCGSIDPNPNLVLSVILEDDSGNIRAVLFKNNAEKLAGMDVEEAMNLIGESKDENAPGNKIKEILVNKQVSVIGRVKYNEYSEQLEFMVDAMG